MAGDDARGSNSTEAGPPEYELKERMRRVHDNTSVEKVETWARAQGLGGFFRLPFRNERDAIASAWWPIPLAAAWVLSRDPDAAIDHWVRQKNWGRDLWLALPWHEATDQIWKALRSARIHAVGAAEAGGASVAIGAVEWQSLTWERVGQVDLISRGHNHRSTYYDVLVDARQVRRHWPPATAADRRAQLTRAEEFRAVNLLARLMRENPHNPVPKAKLQAQHPELTNLPQRAFNRVFMEAVLSTNSSWGKPGRRPKS